MRIAFRLLIELLYLVLSLVIGWVLATYIDITPRFLFGAKNAAISNSEIIAIVSIYLAVGAPVFLLYHLTSKAAVFLDARRTVSELYAVALLTSVAMSVIFIFTTINFSLNFFMLSFITMVLLILATFFVTNWRNRQGSPSQDGRSAGSEFFLQLVKSPFSWTSLAVIVTLAVPVGLAFAYKKDADARNAISKVRQYFSRGGEVHWTLERVFPDASFHQPITVDFSPADPAEIFVLERAGRLYMLSDRPDSGKELVLDFQDQVGKVSGENGAVGFALDPRYDAADGTGNGFVYIYYTHVRPGSQHNRLSRFDLSLEGLQERLDSEFILIEQKRSTGGSHNGGSVEFGPDSFLYLALGDASDERNQQVIDRDLFSGIIRIDVHQQGGDVSHPIRRQPQNGKTQGYFIPNDNPFVGEADVLGEFWAIGLRNPFRMSIDGETGDIWTGDVGLTSFEEVNLVRKGGNYQWPYMEGPERNSEAVRPENLLGIDSPPFYYYAHTGLDRVVIGGIVYRGNKFPELRGRYVFADNFSGRVSALEIDDGPGREPESLAFAEQLNISGITSFNETPQGDIYLTTLGNIEAQTGNVLRLAKIDKAQADRLAEAQSGDADRPREVTLESARAIFASNCTYCHGEGGKGDGAGLEASDVKAPDFSSPEWQASRTDEFLVRVIQDGGTGVGLSDAMPPWKDALSREEIEGLVPVLRELESRDE